LAKVGFDSFIHSRIGSNMHVGMDEADAATMVQQRCSAGLVISLHKNRIIWHHCAIPAALHHHRPNGLSSLFSTTTRHVVEEDPVCQELARVATALRDYDTQYYEGRSSISDDEYDALAVREATICQDHPALLDMYRRNSGLGRQATRFDGRVGAVVNVLSSNPKSPTTTTSILPSSSGGDTSSSSLLRRRHAAPLLSLDNVHTPTQLMAWLERVRKTTANTGERMTILSEPKLDGLSVSLRYDKHNNPDDDHNNLANGLLSLRWAATRGDGTTGTDVTTAMLAIPNLPQQLSMTHHPDNVGTNHHNHHPTLEVRGEVILPPSLLAGNFTNARNAAVGILLCKQPVSHDDEPKKDK
jgi:NAD-dependent DNA ligase